MPEEFHHEKPGPAQPSQSKNIMICCDGTGNEYGTLDATGQPCNSNVVKLYTALKIDNQQAGYYHPGVGTMGAPMSSTKLGNMIAQVRGVGFGYGFRDNVLDVYRYLMETYNDGDRIFIFGFSRGSYTARALCALLHAYGLLCRGNEGHIPYVWTMFLDNLNKTRKKHSTGHQTLEVAGGFKATFSHDVTVHFAGLWDTVSSIGWITEPIRLLYLARNPIIKTGRHAISIDERRCYFVDNLWGEAFKDQDLVQVWFPGVHSDVGSSYAQRESGLSNVTLQWILDEARTAGALIEEPRYEMVFSHFDDSNRYLPAKKFFNPPDTNYKQIHQSLKGRWWLLELLPHSGYDSDKPEPRERSIIPLGRSRTIPRDALIHPSVRKLMHAPGWNYKPRNLPEASLRPYRQGILDTKANLAGFEVYQPDPGQEGIVDAGWIKVARPVLAIIEFLIVVAFFIVVIALGWLLLTLLWGKIMGIYTVVVWDPIRW